MFCLGIAIIRRHSLPSLDNRAGANVTNQQIFAERLARINGHVGNTNATLHIGMEAQLPQAALLRPGGRRVKVAAATGIMTIPVALVCGGIAWIGAHWLRVSVLQPETADRALAADVIGALVLMMLLWFTFGLSGRKALVAQTAGVVLMAVSMHNFVHLWPEAFSPLFPGEWMASVLQGTEPMTIALASAAVSI